MIFLTSMKSVSVYFYLHGGHCVTPVCRPVPRVFKGGGGRG